MKNDQNFSHYFSVLGNKIMGAAARLFVSGVLHLSMVSIAFANPVGGNVISGSATINNTAAGLQINQTSNRAFIDWNSFNIEQGETTRFVQPNSGSIALNRVVNSNQLSTINGNLFANGHVVVINPNGVLIGSHGNVDTAGFIATSSGISNSSDFANSTGVLNFNQAGNANAVVQNNGTITVGQAGLAALVAPTVRNNGIIQGNLAKVQLAAADKFAVDFYGDGLINFTVDSPSGTSGRTIKAENNGSIIADGGKVLLTAAAASDLVDSVVNNTGNIQAHSLVNHNGEIILTGAGADVNVSGTLDASGVGNTNGGTIKIGGDLRGGGTLAKADTVTIDPSATVKADAGANGKGGTIVAWSEKNTVAKGKFYARGGTQSGNGGLVETSSRDLLDVKGIYVNTLAANGKAGTWLIDPDNINIQPSGVPYFPLPGTGTSNIDVNTINSAFSNVALVATNSININASINMANAGVGISMVAGTAGAGIITGTDINGSAVSLVANGNGTISMSGGNFVRTIGGDLIFIAGDNIGFSNSTLFTQGGDVTLISGDIQLNNSSAISTKGGNVLIRAIDDASNKTSGVVGFNSTIIDTTTVPSTPDATDKIHMTEDGVDLPNGDLGNPQNVFVETHTGGIITIEGKSISGNSVCFAAGGPGCIVPDPIPAVNITITADALFKIYGQIDPALTYTYTGVLAVGDSFTGSLVRLAGENVGAYAINQGSVTILTTGSTTYNITYVSANLTINPAALNIIAAAKSKTYGDADPALTYTTSGLVAGDSMTGALTRVAGENVGAYQINQGTVTVGGGKAGNYTITYTPANLTINAKALSIVAAAKSKTYGDADPALTYTTSGLVAGDSMTGALTRVAGENVGAYQINQGTVTVGGGMAGNYTITYTPANLTINAKALSIVAAAKSKTYGDADPALTYTTSGLVAGDSMTGALTRVAGENVGAYQINQGTVTVGGGMAGNYTITYTPANLTINAKALSIVAAAKSKTYGDADPALTYTTSGLVAGDSMTGALTRVAGENVGAYQINQGTVTVGGGNAGNYTITYTPANLTINAKALSIVAAAKSKTYGDADPALTYTTSGLVAGDSMTGALTRVAGENVGAYQINQGTVTVGGGMAGNYTITYTPANLTINAKALSIVAAAKSKTYGDADPALTYTTSGLVAGDSMTGALTRVAGENVGAYQINQGTVTVGGGMAGNYTITYTPANLTINAKALSIVAAAKSKTYGAADPALTYTTSGLVAGDSMTGALTRVAGEDVGAYQINQGTVTVGGGMAGNYIITYTPANLTITAKALQIIADAKSKTYGAADPALTYTTIGLSDGDSMTGVLTRLAGENVGTYQINQGTVTVGGGNAGNYTITYTSANLTIDPKALTITANSFHKTYGDTYTFAGTEFTTSGLVNSDSVDSASISSDGAAAGAGVGGYANNIGSAVGTGLDNYDITYVDGTLTIDPKALTVTANSFHKTYGDTYTFAGTEFTTSGLVNSDSVDSASISSDGAAAGAGVGGYANNIGSAVGTGLDNYDITYVDGTLTIDPKALTVTANSFHKTYGDTYTFAGTEFTTSGLVNSDSVDSASISSDGAAAGAGVGGYANNIGSAVGTGLDNYDITYVDGTLTIDPKALTVTANSFHKTYGDTYTFAGTEFTTSGLVNSDSVDSVELASNGAAAGAGVGGYAINGSDAAGTGLSNYDITYVDGTLTIDPRRLVIAADHQTKVYGDSDPELTYSTNGLVNGDLLSGELARNSGENVGNYGINIGSLDAGSNYIVSYEGNTLTITPATLLVIADNKSKDEGDADPAFTYTASGFKFDDDGSVLSGDLTRDPGEDAGNYAITQGGLHVLPNNQEEASNYVIEFVDGILTIIPAPEINPVVPTVQIDPLSRPIISVADQAINLDLPFESYEALTINTDVGIKGGGNGGLAGIEPAAGGEGDLSDIEPAAGGAPGNDNEDVNCGNNFLENKPCNQQVATLQ